MYLKLAAYLEKSVKAAAKISKSAYILSYSLLLKRNCGPCTERHGDCEWNRISGDDIETEFDYKDETWNEIRFIHARTCLEWWRIKDVPFADNTCKNTRVLFEKDSLLVENTEAQPLRWIFLRYRNRIGSVYAMEYEVTVESDFTELQFAFNYRSIADRVRFMIVDNRQLVFQTVEKGAFIPPLRIRPLRLEHGRKYLVRIEVIRSSFSYSVDGSLVMSISLPSHAAMENDSVAIILFEKMALKPIHARIDHLRVFRGSFPSSKS